MELQFGTLPPVSLIQLHKRAGLLVSSMPFNCTSHTSKVLPQPNLAFNLYWGAAPLPLPLLHTNNLGSRESEKSGVIERVGNLVQAPRFAVDSRNLNMYRDSKLLLGMNGIEVSLWATQIFLSKPHRWPRWTILEARHCY
jgi:hypothetical protein